MSKLRLASLALAAALVGPVALRAQAHAPAAQAAPAPEHAQAEAPQPHEAPAGHGEAQAGHATQGHHGPAVKLFGLELGTTGQFLVKLFNFLLFAGLLFFLLKGALAAAFRARTRELKEALDQAGRDKAEGEAQVRELEARMAGLEQELADIMARAEREAEAERQRIVEAARAEAEALMAQARTDIEAQRRQAEQDLRALVARLAVEGAARRLEAEVQGPVAARVIDQAIGQVGGAK